MNDEKDSLPTIRTPVAREEKPIVIAARSNPISSDHATCGEAPYALNAAGAVSRVNPPPVEYPAADSNPIENGEGGEAATVGNRPAQGGGGADEAARTEDASGARKRSRAEWLEDVKNRREVQREEIMAAMKDCAAKLGRPPIYPEVRRTTGISLKRIRKSFGSYTKLLEACGMEVVGSGYKMGEARLFASFAEVVRELGRVPTALEFTMGSQYSLRPFRTWFGGWRFVPQGMLRYAEEWGLESKWGDVLDILRDHVQGNEGTDPSGAERSQVTLKPWARDDRPVYGAPLMLPAMAYAPTNESGVQFLFGALAEKLGFTVLGMRPEFPDCEAVREIAPGRWQRVRIEFEFESRNFSRHGHDPAGCDLIVCWEHNWKECTLEILELKAAVKRSPESRVIATESP